MAEGSEIAALVALLRHGKRDWSRYTTVLETERSAWPMLQEEQGLLAPNLAEAASAEIERWRGAGYRLLTVLDAGYPDNLRAVHDRPPLLFVAGNYQASDARSVAVIGSRNASPAGLDLARQIAGHLSEDGYTIVSGLARGIDTAAHLATLERGGRTIAVLGTGLAHTYPAANAELQARIARDCAVLSQFWPDAPPTRRSFPMRNAVMSGLTLGTVIVEAGERSGARTQARIALTHGRPVLLMPRLLTQNWAQVLAQRPGTHVVRSVAEIGGLVSRLSSDVALVE